MRDSQKDHTNVTTLKSSSELRWSGLVAELCSYRCAKIAIVLAGSDTGFATYKIGRMRSVARTIPGLIWLKPSGGQYDHFYIASPQIEVFDLYLPSTVFTHLSNDFNLSKMPDRSLRYEGGLRDEVISQIGLMLLSEMMNPTTAGRMLAETASLLLAARLMHGYLDVGLARLPIEARHRLDDRRLHRVLNYVEEHLFHDIAVSDLANVACLSIYHFSRSFSSARCVASDGLRDSRAEIHRLDSSSARLGWSGISAELPSHGTKESEIAARQYLEICVAVVVNENSLVRRIGGVTEGETHAHRPFREGRCSRNCRG